MKYIILLRGINVGGNKKVDMKKIKQIFESIGFTDVSTYINSGNIIFMSNKRPNELMEIIDECIKKEFGFDIRILIKTHGEMKRIADSIPEEWENNSEQKSDVAYLFKDIDSKSIINELPINKDFLDIRYVPGAIFWNIKRKDYNKSKINKLISNKMYKFMTVRNVNTARYLGNI